MISRMRKGFTLIELMIVIAIIAIIAAIAIPNLLQSRIRANEANAVTQVKNYATAQNIWVNGQQSRVPANGGAIDVAGGATVAAPQGYAFTWPNLFYGNPKSTEIPNTGGTYAADTASNLALISKAHADARLDDGTYPTAPVGAPVVVGAVAPLQGYMFANDVTNQEWYVFEISQVAIPTNSRSTGNSAFWVGTQGTVYASGLNPGDDAATSQAAVTTPAMVLETGAGTDAYSGWITM